MTHSDIPNNEQKQTVTDPNGLKLTKPQMSELLRKIREVADRSLRNGASDTASALYYIHTVDELLIEYGIKEGNEIHSDCDGIGCVHCNWGRVRQDGDPVNPQKSKPNEHTVWKLRNLVKAEMK